MDYSSLITYRLVTTQSYTSSYWGSQLVSAFPPELTELSKSVSSFTDITAGGGAYPYYLAQQGVRVNLNDRNQYAFLNLEATFNYDFEEDLEHWFESFCRDSHPDKMTSESVGYLESHLQQPGFPKFNVHTCMYVDWLFRNFKQHHRLVLAATSRTLVSHFTFRGLSWSNKTSDNKPVKDATPEEFWIRMCRTAWRICHYNRLLPSHNFQVTNFGALPCLEVLPIRGGIVYTDPAWPWNQKVDSSNPYTFFTKSVSSIIQQKNLELSFSMWKNSDRTLILNELRTWFDRTFSLGAQYFCLSTQGTNFPDPQPMYDELAEEYKLVWLKIQNVQSASQQKPFTEWFGLFEPRS
jgi:hypothetical protein